MTLALGACAPSVADESEGLVEPISPSPTVLGDPLGYVVNANAASGDTFGLSSSIDGSYAVAGTPTQLVGGLASGAAYVYRGSGTQWGEETRLSIAAGFSPADGDDFGRAVAISGDYLIVGATAKSGGIGALYIFQRTGQNAWGNEVEFQDDPSIGENYGGSVAISGDYTAAAASGALSSQGLVYLYERTGPGNLWSGPLTVTGSDSVTSDQFGRALAIQGDVMVVGSYIGGNGKPYVFRRSAPLVWVEEAILTPSDGGPSDNFASKVAIDGDTILVASRNNAGLGTNRGAVYFYQYQGGTWGNEHKAVSPDVLDYGQLGIQIGLSGDNAVVSAALECASGYCAPGVQQLQGALYVFRRSSGNVWDQALRFVAPDAAGGDELGFSVGISGTSIVAGAAFASPGGLTNAGKVYFFH